MILRLTGWHPGLQKISVTRALQEHAHLGLADAKQATDAVLDGHIVDIECTTAGECLTLADALRSCGAEVTIHPVDSLSPLTSAAVFGTLRDAIAPTAAAAGFIEAEERYSPSEGTRWVSWSSSAAALRLTWDPRDHSFVLEASTVTAANGHRVWEDLTLQHFEQRDASDRWVRELVQDIVPLATDFVWYGH